MNIFFSSILLMNTASVVMSALISAHTYPCEEHYDNTPINSSEFIQTLTEIVDDFKVNPDPSLEEMLRIIMHICLRAPTYNLNDEERLTVRQMHAYLRANFVNILDTATATIAEIDRSQQLFITENH
eukprot:GHVR01177845.1.p1 GENE.GHVR01177845.1~~GHVR01177845.1.p1  ORF type:complete len:127 (-),score=0.67 GHVR01177845.1:543-923(-)